MCPACERPLTHCACPQSGPAAATAVAAATADGTVRVGRETKGRKGKGVTLVTGVPLPSAQLAELCAQLKKKCGSGGTVKDGVIEIQGDHADSLAQELARHGWKVKRAGG